MEHVCKKLRLDDGRQTEQHRTSMFEVQLPAISQRTTDMLAEDSCLERSSRTSPCQHTTTKNVGCTNGEEVWFGMLRTVERVVCMRQQCYSDVR